MAKIKGIDGMSIDQVNAELRRGGKFVVYQYAISIIIMTFRRSSSVYFIPSGESSITKGLKHSLVTFFFGWWGIPWGPIYSIGSLWKNFSGGKDVTPEVIQALSAPQEIVP